jgi:hypothetical protein
MRAAARPDAPIFRPTSRFGVLLAPVAAFSGFAFGLRWRGMSCFQNGFEFFFGFGSLAALGFRLKESSFFSSDCFFGLGSGGSSEAGTGGWIPGAGSGMAAAAAAAASCSRTQSSSATGLSSAGGFGLRLSEISFFQNGTGFSAGGFGAFGAFCFRANRSESLISFFQSAMA